MSGSGDVRPAAGIAAAARDGRRDWRGWTGGEGIGLLGALH